MSVELCPRCRAVRTMRIAVTVRSDVDADGHAVRIETRTYSCEKCGIFVRREEVELPAPVRRESDEVLLQRDTEPPDAP